MAWYPLALSPTAGAHLPALLISTAFTPSSFTVHLTDLTYIWSESLKRAEIIQRSSDEATSIDPSEEGQLKIFLEKMKLGLAGGKGTTLALTINDGADRPSLVLSVTVDLPGRLTALQWPVRLSAAPQALLTSQLTLPLLQTQHALMQERTGLVDILKDKDHVIQKLLDKIEEQGIDLGQMFPQAAGKVGRKVDRKKAEEKVRGIARFEVEAWQQGLSHDQPEDTSKLIGEVFGEQTDARNEVPVTSEEESWWDDIKGLTVHLDTGKISTKGPSQTNPKPQVPSLHKDETQQEDDAFQTQPSPPPAPLKTSPSKPSSKATNVDSSTDDDDDDLDAPSQRSRIPDSFQKSPPPPTPKPTKKLGALGKKKAAREPTPNPPPAINDDNDSTTEEASSPKTDKKSPTPKAVSVPHRPQKKLGKIGSKKAAPPPEPEPEPEPAVSPSSSTEDDEVQPEKAPSSSPPPAPKPKKGKLGRIGGKKNPPVTENPQPQPQPEPDAEPPTSTPPISPPGSTAATPKRKLGALGGGRKVKREDSVKEEENLQSLSQRGRSLQAEKEKTKTPERKLEPEKRETSLERADRKREALKRELEEKARAPVKKKRKF